jgi:hypothetical protein
MAERSEAPSYPLHAFQVLDRPHIQDGINFLRVGLDPSLRNNEPKEHATRNPENAFFRVKPDPVRTKSGKHLLEVGYELVGLLGFHHDVIDVCLNGLLDEVAKTFDHAALVGCAGILQAERHRNITIQAERGDEGSRELVGLLHHDLVIPRVGVKVAEGFAP